MHLRQNNMCEKHEFCLEWGKYPQVTNKMFVGCQLKMYTGTYISKIDKTLDYPIPNSKTLR